MRKNIQRYIMNNWIFFAAFLITVILLSMYRSEPEIPVDPESKYSKYYIEQSDGTLVPLYLETAISSKEKSQGLMYRETLPKSHGMIFIFDHPQLVSFWMKNTYIKLDILMLDEEGILKEIHRNNLPESRKSIRSKAKIKYVVELNAGETRKHNIKLGDVLLIDRPN